MKCRRLQNFETTRGEKLRGGASIKGVLMGVVSIILFCHAYRPKLLYALFLKLVLLHTYRFLIMIHLLAFLAKLERQLVPFQPFFKL